MGVIALCFSFLVPRGLTPGSSRITSAVPLPTGLLNTGQAALAVVRPAEWGEPPNFGRPVPIPVITSLDFCLSVWPLAVRTSLLHAGQPLERRPPSGDLEVRESLREPKTTSRW